MTWQAVLNPIMNKPHIKKLLNNVDYLYNQEIIYPSKNDLFKAFEITPYERLKIVILGQDPYHDKDQAMGLAFSVPKDVKIPPSLKNIYKELQDDLAIKTPNHGDLTSWAKEGVLLLNTTFTVQAHQPLSHKDLGWEDFTNDVIKSLNDYPEPLVFMLWGNHAKSKQSLIKNTKHLVLTASHPSPLGAYRSFFGCQHFSKANDYLVKHGRKPVDFKL